MMFSPPCAQILLHLTSHRLEGIRQGRSHSTELDPTWIANKKHAFIETLCVIVNPKSLKELGI